MQLPFNLTSFLLFCRRSRAETSIPMPAARSMPTSHLPRTPLKEPHDDAGGPVFLFSARRARHIVRALRCIPPRVNATSAQAFVRAPCSTCTALAHALAIRAHGGGDTPGGGSTCRSVRPPRFRHFSRRRAKGGSNFSLATYFCEV